VPYDLVATSTADAFDQEGEADVFGRAQVILADPLVDEAGVIA
jgi:hypothetical protein